MKENYVIKIPQVVSFSMLDYVFPSLYWCDACFSNDQARAFSWRGRRVKTSNSLSRDGLWLERKSRNTDTLMSDYAGQLMSRVCTGWRRVRVITTFHFRARPLSPSSFSSRPKGRNANHSVDSPDLTLLRQPRFIAKHVPKREFCARSGAVRTCSCL